MHETRRDMAARVKDSCFPSRAWMRPLLNMLSESKASASWAYGARRVVTTAQNLKYSSPNGQLWPRTY